MLSRVRTVVGCMTGTSIDSIDAAVVRVEGAGLDLSARLEAFVSDPLGGIAGRLRSYAEGGALAAGEAAELARDFGARHAEVIRAAAGDRPIDLIAVHGQTVFHRPPLTVQLVDPWPIAEAFGCRVVSDLRAADCVRGGQGAPITPLVDWVLLRVPDRTRVVVNLGGFCNLTVVPGGLGLGAVRGFDVCACNQVLDGVARVSLGAPFDRDGAAALAGRVDDAALADLRAILTRQAGEGRSLGTGDEAAAWVGRSAGRLGRAAGPTTAAAGVSGVIGDAVERASADVGHGPVDVLLAGGGARNAALVRGIEARIAGSSGPAGITVRELDRELDGVDAASREAVAMGVLGALADDGVEITLPGVTGRRTGGRPLQAGSWIG